MDIYKEILELKSKNHLTYKELGEPIQLSNDAMRMALKNKTLNFLQTQELVRFYKLDSVKETKVFESVQDLELKQKIVEFGQFFSENEDTVLKNPTIQNIIEKQVAKRLVKLTKDAEALKSFLGD